MKSASRLLAVAAVATLLGLSPAPSRADQIYGVTYFDNQLVSIDSATGAGSVVAPLGTSGSPFGLANVGGSFYTYDGSAGLVSRIDPTSGAVLSAVDVGIGPVISQGGFTFEDHTTGFLTVALDANFNPVNSLYEFNLATGKSTLLGSTTDTIQALAYGDGSLFAMGKNDGDLYKVDTTTGALTLVGNVGFTVGNSIGSMAFGPGGTLYATLNDSLYTLNTATGAATEIGTPFGFNSISGIAFAAVPEPSSLAMTCLGLAGALGLAFRRRMKAGRPG